MVTVVKDVIYRASLQTLIRTCYEKKMDCLHQELKEKYVSKCVVMVHIECRKRFTDKRKSETVVAPNRKRLRSSIDNAFDWKNISFICGGKADIRHRVRDSIRRVHTLPVHGKVIDCANRRDDKWGKEVLSRVENCI